MANCPLLGVLRVRFTIRAMMVGVVVVAIYSTAILRFPPVGEILVYLTVPPLLWTTMWASRRRSAGDPMSAVEWAVHLYVATIITCLLGVPTMWLFGTLFPVVSY